MRVYVVKKVVLILSIMEGILLISFGMISNRMLLSLGIALFLVYSNFLTFNMAKKSLNFLIDIRIYLLAAYTIYSLYMPTVYLAFNKTGYFQLSGDLNIYKYNTLITSLIISIIFLIICGVQKCDTI